MGQAKVAELNQYPGPRHVLQIAFELNLLDEQKTRAQQLYDRMHNDAVKLGAEIVLKEKLLNDSFAGGTIEQNSLEKLLDELAGLQGKLRFTHLEAHLGMKHLLTNDQIKHYDELRGYHHAGMNHQD